MLLLWNKDIVLLYIHNIHIECTYIHTYKHIHAKGHTIQGPGPGPGPGPGLAPHPPHPSQPGPGARARPHVWYVLLHVYVYMYVYMYILYVYYVYVHLRGICHGIARYKFGWPWSTLIVVFFKNALFQNFKHVNYQNGPNLSDFVRNCSNIGFRVPW